jgi:hypothetical protein
VWDDGPHIIPLCISLSLSLSLSLSQSNIPPGEDIEVVAERKEHVN